MKLPRRGERSMLKCFRTLIPALSLAATVLAAQPNGTLQYQSAFMRVEMASDQPAFVSFTVDSLGKNKLSANPLRPPAKAETTYQLRHVGDIFEYRPSGTSAAALPAWTFQFSPRQIIL